MKGLTAFSHAAKIRKQGRRPMIQAHQALGLRSGAALLTMLVVSAAVLAATTCQALATPTFTAFDVSVKDKAGNAVTQAGAHPYEFATHFALATKLNFKGDSIPTESLKDVDVSLPAGFIGDPSATPTCDADDFYRPGRFNSACPAASQVGLAKVVLGGVVTYTFPVFNLKAPPGHPAQFGFVPLYVPVYINPSVRTGSDYGLTTSIHNVSQALPVTETTLTLWGVPADPAHNRYRGSCLRWWNGTGSGNCPSNAPMKPFLTMPTSCSSTLEFGLRADSWADPGNYVTDTAANLDAASSPAAVDGCDRLDFRPSIDVRADTTAAGSPAGYAVDVSVPQNTNPSGLAESHLRHVVVAMPPGTAVSAAGADGLAACAPGQVELDSAQPATCPDASKIGTVSIETPLLSQPLQGGVFLASQGDNPFGSLLAIYLVAEGQGVTIKLAGKIEPDPATGDLVATFDDTPQLPFSRMHLQFLGGARAPLVNPTSCGSTTAKASFSSWGGSAAVSESTVEISGDGNGGPCAAARFTPELHAGVTSPVAGRSSTFSFQLLRSDADQEVSSIKATLPAGLLAKVSGVPLCPAAAAANGTCGDGARVGHVTVGVGAGAHPFYVQGGRAYLTEGYRGAPYGLSLVVPAIAGPLNLRTVVIRAAVNIDPHTAQITVDTDALPTMLQGIPLNMRDIRLMIDRAGFMVNPTSCAEQQVSATVTPVGGSPATVATRFQVGDCQALTFKPHLAMSLTGAKETKLGGHPGLTADVAQPEGQANLRQVRVRLPKDVGIDLKNLGGVCKAADADKGSCPDSAIIGRATVAARILSHELSGKVYLVEGKRTDPKTGKTVSTLPRLWVPLRGDVSLDLWADTAVEGGRIVTTFGGIPDAPISSFHLQIDGGSKGVLVTSADVCKSTQTGIQEIDAQSGKTADATLLVKTPCGLRVLSRHLSSKQLTLRVGGLGAGRLTVTGNGLRRTSRALHGAQVATIRVSLSLAGQQRVADGGGVAAKVSFRDTATKSTNSITTTVHLARG